MMRRPQSLLMLLVLLLGVAPTITAQHNHPAPEKLGTVVFPTACMVAAQPQFNRAVALLHSFAYSESEKAFQQVLTADRSCAMAHWGVAMTYYHQLWEPPLNKSSYAKGASELGQIKKESPRSTRESQYIAALQTVYSNADKQSLRERKIGYEHSMADVAKSNPSDMEAQVFFALALLSTAPPTDKTHANQKKAVALLP